MVATRIFLCGSETCVTPRHAYIYIYIYMCKTSSEKKLRRPCGDFAGVASLRDVITRKPLLRRLRRSCGDFAVGLYLHPKARGKLLKNSSGNGSLSLKSRPHHRLTCGLSGEITSGGHVQKDGMGEDEGEASTAGLTIDIHNSHKALHHCGGHYACLDCGRTAQRNDRSNRLRDPCRGVEATPKGTRSEAKRISKGMHPLDRRSKRCIWPNGESDPVPSKVQKTHRLDSAAGSSCLPLGG